MYILIAGITLLVLVPILCSKKTIKMRCSCCEHEWEISKRVYMCTPYTQRGVNNLFRCAKCGSEGQKTKKKNYRN